MNVQMVDRETERFDSLGTDVHDMYDIFKPHKKCTNPRVVLVEGEPGMGKSMFCQKVALDWSEGKTGKSFPSFKILLKLNCQEVESSAAIGINVLKKSITDQLLAHETERLKTGLFNYLEDPESRVLLVLDGLDELNQDIDIFHLIKQELDPWRCNFLLTSRNDPKLREHCDSLFQIIGFANEDAECYIRKFFGETDQEIAEHVIDSINESSQDGATLRELVSNPFIASLICYVGKELNGKLPSSKAQLYQEMIRCILRRYFTKRNEEPPEDPIEECKEDLAVLGCLALNGIENDRLHFIENEIPTKGCTRNILKFGFLSKQVSSSGIRPPISYQFLHKTFQEFFAAFSLSEQSLLGDTALLRSLSQSKFKQVLLFTVGLLSQKPEALENRKLDFLLRHQLATNQNIPGDKS